MTIHVFKVLVVKKTTEVENVWTQSCYTIFKRYFSNEATFVSGSILRLQPLLSSREVSPGALSNLNRSRLVSIWKIEMLHYSIIIKLLNNLIYHVHVVIFLSTTFINLSSIKSRIQILHNLIFSKLYNTFIYPSVIIISMINFLIYKCLCKCDVKRFE